MDKKIVVFLLATMIGVFVVGSLTFETCRLNTLQREEKEQAIKQVKLEARYKALLVEIKSIKARKTEPKKEVKKAETIVVNLRRERPQDMAVGYFGSVSSGNYFTCSKSLQRKYGWDYGERAIRYKGEVYRLHTNCSEASYFGDGENIGILNLSAGKVVSAKVEVL